MGKAGMTVATLVCLLSAAARAQDPEPVIDCNARLGSLDPSCSRPRNSQEQLLGSAGVARIREAGITQIHINPAAMPTGGMIVELEGSRAGAGMQLGYSLQIFEPRAWSDVWLTIPMMAEGRFTFGDSTADSFFAGARLAVAFHVGRWLHLGAALPLGYLVHDLVEGKGFALGYEGPTFGALLSTDSLLPAVVGDWVEVSFGTAVYRSVSAIDGADPLVRFGYGVVIKLPERGMSNPRAWLGFYQDFESGLHEDPHGAGFGGEIAVCALGRSGNWPLTLAAVGGLNPWPDDEWSVGLTIRLGSFWIGGGKTKSGFIMGGTWGSGGGGGGPDVIYY
jgi:hypothetical protein